MKAIGVGPALMLALFVSPAWADAPKAAGSAVLHVGKGKTFASPSQAAMAAKDGDTVEIDAGTYPGDVAVWRANRLTLRGVGGRPVLDAKGHVAESKAIWVVTGKDTTVENMEFTGAAVPDKNGAGIRQEGDNLTVRNCFFHDNEDGILGGGGPDSDVLVENSAFDHNGQGDGYSHNLYIGHVRRFTLRGCYSHNAKAGHDVKSRAAANFILYNRISDDDSSDTSYLIDLPNGGNSALVGNVLRRGPNASQGILISFAEEGATNPKQALALINNTLVSSRRDTVFVRAAGQPAVKAVNNLRLGAGAWLPGADDPAFRNLVAAPADCVNAGGMDFRPARSSAAIDAGAAPGKSGDFDLTPRFEFAPPSGFKPRAVQGALDVGAYERSADR